MRMCVCAYTLRNSVRERECVCVRGGRPAVSWRIPPYHLLRTYEILEGDKEREKGLLCVLEKDTHSKGGYCPFPPCVCACAAKIGFPICI